MNAMDSMSKWYSEEVNGDLWTRVFSECRQRTEKVDLTKAKSHVKDEEEWKRYGMDEEKLVMNEAADVVANVAAHQRDRSTDAVLADLENLNLAYLIAMRIAVIEADVWEKQPEKDYAPKSNEEMKEKWKKVIKHNMEQAKVPTSLKHNTYIVGKWMRCRHCPSAALVEKSIRESTRSNSYWKKTPCGKLIERVTCRRLEGTALEYMLHEPTELFNMADGDDDLGLDHVPAQSGSSTDPPAATPPQTIVVRKGFLDDSDADPFDQCFNGPPPPPTDSFEELPPPPSFEEPPQPKRFKLNKKTSEGELQHKHTNRKRKFDYVDVREAIASYRKVSAQEYRQHAEKESRASKPREVEQIVIAEQGEHVEVAGGWNRVHPSHVRAMVHNIIFCVKCGAWMSSICRRMGKQCMRVPPYKQAKSQLRRLMRGQYPWKHLDWPDGTPGTTVFKPVRLDNFD